METFLRLQCCRPFGVMYSGKFLARSFLLLLILLAFLSVKATSMAQTKVSLDLKEVSVSDFFRAVKQQTNLSFLYNSALVDGLGSVSISVKDADLDRVLQSVLSEKGLTYEFEGNAVVVKKAEQIQTQAPCHIYIVGKVTDSNKQPLPGVAVFGKKTRIGAATDVNGKYQLVLTDSTEILVFSFLGMKSVEIKYKGQKEINVVMVEEATQMDEVTVISTGYQDIDRRKLTSAVTAIKMDDIRVPGLSSVTEMLEGHVPGMTFMQNSGQVGATPRVRIRGTSTVLGSQEPLWVLDGIILQDPVNVDPAQLNDLDFVNLLGNAISGLNPDDIEQIDVLKDAAATAIYGARAANGVIVITTKKGKAGPPSVSYSMSGTFSRRPYYSDKTINLMNSKERVDLSREQFEKGMVFYNITEFDGFEKAYTDYKAGLINYGEYKRLTDYYETINTDWFDVLCRNSFSMKHTLALSGGSEACRYYASVGYNDERGVIKHEDKQTYTGTLRVNGSFDKGSYQFGVTFNTSEADHVPTDATGKNIIQYAYELNRALPAYNPDGSPYYYVMGNLQNKRYANLFNAEEEMKNTANHVGSSSYTLTGNVRYHLLDGLTADGTLSYSGGSTTQLTTFNEESYYIKQLKNSPNGSMCPLGGEWRSIITHQRSWTGRLQFNYSRYFGDDKQHFTNVALGGEISSSKYTNLNETRRGYFEDRGKTFAEFESGYLADYPRFSDWLMEQKPTISESLTNMLSGYITLTYSFNDRYTLNFNTRMDGSNQFGSRSNEKLLPIWSVSGRWDIGKEFWDGNPNVNELAFKFSYGKQGNMLNNQTSRMIINKGGPVTWFGDDAFESTIANYPNPDLRWETTNSYNGEIVFSLLKNKISGSVGYYYKKTTDAFLNKQVSEINGVSTYVINEGTLINQGVEVAFSFTPINQQLTSNGKRGFVWRFDPQIGQAVNSLISRAINNKNTIVQDKINYKDFLNGNVQISGKPLNTFYSYRFKGLTHETGMPEFYGVEEENKEALHARFKNMSDEEICLEIMEESGTRVPILQGGFSNYIGYRQFGLSFNFSYSLGNKIRLLRLMDDMNIRPYPTQNVRREMLARWRKPGDEKYTNIPGIVTDNTLPQGWWNDEKYREEYTFADASPYRMYDYSDIRVVSGNYLKLQSLSLRYNLPDEFCKRMHLKSAYFTLAGTNLFTIASKDLKGQDVTQSGSSTTINLSVRPNYSFALNITF